MEPRVQPSIATAPFDKEDADAIFRSSDNVDFHVYKVVLRLASPFFEDMFSIPQPVVPGGQDVDGSIGSSVIDVTEDSQTLDRLFRMCYPVMDPEIQDVAEIGMVLEAAIKYQLEEATASLKKLLVDLSPREPVRVYAIACRFNLEYEAKIAAAASMQVAEIEYEAEMDNISAGAFYRLLEYRRTRRDMSDRMVDDFTFCRPTQSVTETLPTAFLQLAELPTITQPFEDASADTIIRSADGIEYRVHKVILTLASSAFADLIHSSSQTSPDGFPVVTVSEDSRTLLSLLQVCYPSEDAELKDLETANAVLQAATKYHFRRGVQYAKRKWMEQMNDDPLRVYFVAMRHNWEAEASQAAQLVIYETFDCYCPEMENVSAKVYYRLLEYRTKCRDILHHEENFAPGSYRWGSLNRGYDSAYDWFFHGYRTTTRTGQRRSRTVLAAPIVASSHGYSYGSTLESAINESEALEERLHGKLFEIKF